MNETQSEKIVIDNYIQKLELAINNRQSNVLLQLLSDVKSISLLKKTDVRGFYSLLELAINTGNIDLVEAFFKQQHLCDTFRLLYLEGELNNDFLSFIMIMWYKIDLAENQLSALKVIKIIFDGFLTYVSNDEFFPDITQRDKSGYILHKNVLYLYDHTKRITNRVMVYNNEDHYINILDFFAQNSVEKISLQQYSVLNTELSLEADSNDPNTDTEISNIPAPLQNFDHQRFKDFSPTSQDFSFYYKTIPSKNQKAIINQISQYLTLLDQIDSISQIQDGICQPLTHLFDEMPLDKWKKLNEKLLKWDGTQENLDALSLNDDFKKILSFINRYQFKELTTHSYFYIDMNLHSDILLEKMGKESVFLANPWHQIVLKKTENNSFLVYDPNYNSGVKEIKTADELKKLVNISLGNNIAGFSKKSIVLPDFEIKDGNAFIREGGLFLLFNKLPDLLPELPQRKDIDKDSLTGLLLRDILGIPLWARSSNNKQLLNYLHDLVMEFMSIYPDFKSELTKSLEVMPDVLIRQLGLDWFTDVDSDLEFSRKIRDFYQRNPDKLNIHEIIVSICNEHIKTIESHFQDPIVLAWFYDLMHSLNYFKSRWESVKSDKILHLRNTVQDVQLIISASNKKSNQQYFKVVDKKNMIKKYPIPNELQKPLMTITKHVYFLYKNTPAFSSHKVLDELLSKRTDELLRKRSRKETLTNVRLEEKLPKKKKTKKS